MRHILLFLSIVFICNNIQAQTISLTDSLIIHPHCYDSLTGKIKIKAVGGIKPYSYQWNNGVKTDSLINVKGGKYIVTITDSSVPTKQLIKQFELITPKRMEVFWHFECGDLEGNWVDGPEFVVILDSVKNISFGQSYYVFAQYKGTGFPRGSWVADDITKKELYLPMNFYRKNMELSVRVRASIPFEKHCIADYTVTLPSSIKKMQVTINPDTVFLDKGIKNELLTTQVYNTQDLLKSIKWERIDSKSNKKEVINCFNCLTLNIQEQNECIYRIKVENKYHCTATDETYVLDKVQEIKSTTTAYLPTAFSPNDDGINDYFTAFSGGEVTKVLRMEVYDRWGGLIFQNTDFEPNVEAYGWNGKQRGTDVPQGNYTYTFRLLLKDGSEKTAKGEVMLMR
jgi:gliding motility-associated-like protein